jgi:putative transposase
MSISDNQIDLCGSTLAHLLEQTHPRYAQRGKRGMKLSKEVKEDLRGAVERVYLRREQAPVTHVIDEVRAMIAEKNKNLLPGEAVLEMPSRMSVYRYIEQLDSEEVDTARFGKWMARQKHHQVEAGPRVERPNERWELDHTLLDVVVKDVRRWLANWAADTNGSERQI